MAKIIKLTPDIIDEAKSALLDALSGMKLFDGKISFQKNLSPIDRKATLLFSEIAWVKMTSLVSEYASEIGWHGRASRVEGAPDTYLVDDIYVYPQNVTGTTVTPDQAEYEKWLNEFDDDTFNSIRFHGHSHVNMATSPSGVDTGFWSEILDQLDDGMFYIFMIMNKKWERHVRIYDMKTNLYFEPEDVSVRIRNDGFGIEAILRDAKSKVKTVTYTPQPAYQKPASYQTSAHTALPTSKPAKTDKWGREEKKNARPFGGLDEDMYDAWYGYGAYR